jgi:CubicO group peptidase (beta-lactamase class C family)
MFASMRSPSRLRTAATVATLLASLPRPLTAQPTPAWTPILDSIANAALAWSRAPGMTVAIVADNRVVYARGYGVANAETGQPMSADMLLRVGSVTKMFTGTMLAELAESRGFDLETPIGSYVPSLAGKQVGTVTTHQLMTHSAGWIDNAVAYGRMGEGALGEVMREVTDTLFFTGAGRTFSYSNPGISMAGYVGEVAGKQRFATLVETLVLRPSGMRLSTFKPLEAMTWPLAHGHQAGADTVMRLVRPMTENTAQWAAGFLFATAPEVARFTIALMNGGMIDGQQAFSRGAARRVTTGYVAHPGGSGLDSAMYSYGLVVGRMGGERVWTHGGSINGYNASVTMLPDRKAAVIVMVNGPGGAIATIEREALRLAAGFVPRPPDPSAPRALTAAERTSLVGRYAMARTAVDLVEQDGRLLLQQGLARVPVEAAGANQLVATLPNGSVQRLYYRITEGKADYVYLGSRALARQPAP